MILSALTAGIIISLAAVVVASVLLYYTMPMDAEVHPALNAQLSMYINSTQWTNGTAVSWNVTAGQTENKTFDLHNDGNVNLQVSMYISGLPPNWTLVFAGNQTTHLPNEWLNSTLALTVSQDAASGHYYWSPFVTAT